MSLAPSQTGRLARRYGLSLQEMLIVVAVFIVLAMIFFISSGLVLTKTRTSRVKQDQKALAMALNAYLGDHSDYPTTEQGLPLLLQTPILSSLPKDPFSVGGQKWYRYYRFTNRETSQPYYVIVSPGPDGDLDFDPLQSTAVISDNPAAGPSATASLIRSWDEFSVQLELKHYDPTNGINSDGDIIEFEKPSSFARSTSDKR